MALPIKKVYVDTAYKAPGSRTNSDFRFQLPESLTMPDNAVFFVDDVSVPHSWRTIEPGINDRFFFQLSTTEPNDDIRPDYGYNVELESKVYTGTDLAAELQTKMNAAAAGLFADAFTASYDYARNQITIATTFSEVIFRVLTTGDLESGIGDATWVGPAFDPKRPNDINGEMLKQSEGASDWFGFGSPWVSESVSLQPIRNLYLYSPNLGSYSTVGPNGEASILKVIPVSAPPGSMILDQVVAGNDYLDCGRQTLRTLEFQLKDVHGNLVPFHGSNLSFSLVFDVVSEGR